MHSTVASTAEHPHVYGKTRGEGSSNPPIYSTSDPPRQLSLTHIPQCIISPPPHTPYPLFHPHSGSSCHHLSSIATPEKPIQTTAPHRHGMLAKRDGVLSGSWLQPPSLLPLSLPPCCFSTFSQHAWCISRVARQCNSTAPVNALQSCCTFL